MTGEEPTDELLEIVDASDLRTLSWEPFHVMSPGSPRGSNSSDMSARFWLQADATPCARLHRQDDGQLCTHIFDMYRLDQRGSRQRRGGHFR